MTQQTVDAIYANGVLRPLAPIEGLAENATVTVTVHYEDKRQALRDCVGILPDEDAKEMLETIEREFEQVDPNDWK
jgi:predicted DNA-binding antitoxin AbrB/MazE fold protein